MLTHVAFTLGEELTCGLIAMGLTVIGAFGYGFHVSREMQKQRNYLQNLKLPDAIPRCPKCKSDLSAHLNEGDEFSAFRESTGKTVVCDCLLVSRWDTLGSIPALMDHREPTPEEVKRHQDTQIWRKKQKQIEELTQGARK